MHYKGMLRKGLRGASEVTSTALGLYGSYRGLMAMGSELYGAFSAARAGLAVAAPLAVAAI